MLSITRGIPLSLRQFGQWIVSMTRLKLWWYGPRYVAKAAAMAQPPGIDTKRRSKESYICWHLCLSPFKIYRAKKNMIKPKLIIQWKQSINVFSNLHNIGVDCREVSVKDIKRTFLSWAAVSSFFFIVFVFSSCWFLSIVASSNPLDRSFSLTSCDWK